MSRLRRLLEPDRAPRATPSVLLSRPPGYALRLDDDALDARGFARLVDRAGSASPAEADALLGRALSLWSGHAYAEFADTTWARAEAARLHELQRVAVEGRARARLRRGRADGAVPDLEGLVAAHPLREDAVGLLAVALYRTGRQADALAVLAATRRRLAGELGVDPGPRLRGIEAAVLGHRDPGPDAGLPDEPGPPGPGPAARADPGSPDVPHPGAPAPGAPPPTALVGRGPELARLAAAAERARRGAQLVLVVADAGAGKSALLAAFAAERAGAGWTTVTGRCAEIDGAPPGWAWREIVDGLLDACPEVSDAVRDRLAPLRTRSGPDGPSGTFWLARAVVELLEAVRRPLLLVLDDLHRAETETLQLLRSVLTGAAAVPVLVAGALRPGEAGPELDAALAALAEPTADRITPAPLAAADVAVLLARHGVTDVDDTTAVRTAERTGGNPLFVRELARLVAAEGPDAAASAVPAGVREVLRRRLSRLPAPTRSALARVSVLGRDLDVDEALELAAGPDGPDGPDPLDLLEPAVLGGMLVEPGPGRLRFSHELVRDTLYADVPQLRRSRLHAAALELLARRHPDDPVPLAHHALAAGPAIPAERALRLARDAARATAGSGGHREAARLLGQAVALAGSAGAGPAAELELRCARAAELARAGAGLAAIAERQAAVELARSAVPDALGAALTSYDAPVSWTIRPGQHVDADLVALLERALADTRDPTQRVRLLAALAFEVEAHDDDRVRSASAEAMALTADAADPHLRCLALNARFFAVLGPDLWPELAGVGTELAEVAARSGHAGYRTQSHHLLLMVAAGRHDLAAAQEHADAAVAGAPGGQLEFTLGWATIFAALRAVVAGDLDGAEDGYRRVSERLVAAGQANGALMGLLGRFAVRHAQDRLGELAPELAALLGSLPPAFSDFVALARLRAGDPAGARAVWRPAEPIARSYYWLVWTAVRAEVAAGLGDRAVAAACRDLLRPWAGSVAGLSSGTIALGPTDLVLAELAGLLDDPDGRAAHLRAAAGVAERLGSPHWRDRARARLAAQVPNTSADRRR